MDNRPLLRKSIIGPLLFVAIFGMASGIIGTILVRVYLWEAVFNIPFVGTFDFSSQTPSGSSVVIQGARKVVVEQNTKVEETIASVENSFVAIFKSVATDKMPLASSTGPSADRFYDLDRPVGQGFVITSDGWIMSHYWPSEFNALPDASTTRAQLLDSLAKQYTIATKDRMILPVISVKADIVSHISFWRVASNDLPVKKISTESVMPGQQILALSWEGNSLLTTISGIKDPGNDGVVRLSDNYDQQLILAIPPDEDLYGSYVFNFNNELFATVGLDGVVRPISYINSCINCLLNGEEPAKPMLGLYYIDLSRAVSTETVSSGKGAMVAANEKGIYAVPGSPAAKAGFVAGDIISAINNIEIDRNNGLDKLIGGFMAGDEISVTYIHQGQRKDIKVKLGKKN